MAEKRRVYAITCRTVISGVERDHQYFAACDEGSYIVDPFEVRLRPDYAYKMTIEYRDGYTENIETEANPEMRRLEIVPGRGGNFSVAVKSGGPGEG